MTKLMGPGAMAVPSDLDEVKPPGPTAEELRRTGRDKYSYLSVSGLRKRFEPMHDSFIIRAGAHIEEQPLFQIPRGQIWNLSDPANGRYSTSEYEHVGSKIERDTNFMYSGQLGHPLHAYWTWMKLVFECWDNVNDAIEVLMNGEIKLMIGLRHQIIPISSMTPILPEGADKNFEKRIGKNGMLWPWLKIDIGPHFVDPTCVVAGHIRVNGMRASRVRGKVLLGPTLYVQR